jgi:hypothetical protein
MIFVLTTGNLGAKVKSMLGIGYKNIYLSLILGFIGIKLALMLSDTLKPVLTLWIIDPSKIKTFLLALDKLKL